MVIRQKGLKTLIVLLAAVLGLAMVPAVQAAFEVTPSGYWTFDGDEPWVDTMGNGEDASSIFTPESITGQIGGAQNLGGDDNIVVDDNANGVFDFATGAEFTIEFWMKSNADPNTDLPLGEPQGIVSRQVSAGTFTSATWWIGLNTAGIATAFFVDADGMSPNVFEELTGSTVIVDGNWHHIAVVRTFAEDMGTVTDNTFRLYVDGALEDTMDDSGRNRSTGSFDFTGYLHIGDIRDANRYNGAIDNLAFYNSTALTAAQVLNNYARGANGNELDAALAPTFLGTGSGTAIVGYESSFQVSAGGDQPLTYSSSDLPDGAELGSDSGLITWLPNDGQAGANDFTVTATNDEGTADQDWSVTVEDLCTAAIDVYWKLDETDPSAGVDDVTGAAPQGACGAGGCPTSATGKVGTAYDFSGGDVEISFDSDTVFDIDGGIGFSIEFWMKLAAAGGGGNEVIIGRWDGASNFWWIGVNGSGVPLMHFDDSVGSDSSAIQPGKTNLADNDWHHIVVVRDATADSMTMYVDGKVEIFTDQTGNDNTDGSFASTSPVTIGGLSGLGDFYYSGSIDEVAIYNKALSATAVAAHTATNGDQYYCNEAPVIDALLTTATEGQDYNQTATATDPEGNAVVTWSLDSAPNGMTIDETTGEISWTPGDGISTASVVVQAIDEYGATGELSYTIDVTGVDSSPVITGQVSLGTSPGTPITTSPDHLKVADSDNDYPDDFTLTVQAGTNYTVSGNEVTPDAGFSGTLTVPVTVNDGNSDSPVFNLEITVAAGANTAPVIDTTAPTTATVGKTYTYDADASDANGDTLTWSLIGAPIGMTLDTATGEVSWTPSAEGDVSFTLSVSDGNNGDAEEAITITVSPASNGGGGGGGGGGCFIGTTAGAQAGNGLYVAIVGLLGFLGMMRQRF